MSDNSTPVIIPPGAVVLTEADINNRINTALSDIKSKLDDAYSRRDEALSALKQAEKEKTDAEVKALEQQGKEKEALEAKIAQLEKELNERDASIEALIKENDVLKCDNVVREHLGGIDFRQQRAFNTAFREIKGLLKKDKDGNWVSADSGKSIKETIEQFLKDPENAYLLKKVESKGPDLDSHKQTQHKPVGELSQDELLEKIEKGEVTRRTRRGR